MKTSGGLSRSSSKDGQKRPIPRRPMTSQTRRRRRKGRRSGLARFDVGFVLKAFERLDHALDLVPVAVVGLLHDRVASLLAHVPSERCTGDDEPFDTSIPYEFSGQHHGLCRHWYSKCGGKLVKSL